MKNLLFTLLIYLLLTSTLLYAKKDMDTVNYLELASLMLKDGNLERAQIALSQIDQSNENLDIQRFFIISGLLNIRLNNNKEAIKYFQKAKEISDVDTVINVYLAQAAYAIKEYQLAIQSLKDAGNSIDKIPSIYHMRAQSYWYLNNPNMAIATLNQASEIFEDDKSFPRRKIFYYIQLGYNKEASILGKSYLEKFQGDLNDFVAIGNALYRSGDIVSALNFLEIAKLKFPNNEGIAKSLAAIYISKENYYSAAKIIHDISYINQSLIKEAAELYRRAGAEYLALSLNGLISDQNEKLKQRMALMLQLENFEQAAGMENSLKRIHLDKDENIQYALAYSFFKIGNYSKSENYLSQITDTDLFKKAIELRKIMIDCKTESWRCQ
jgi:tetratricopeptide (TPR) repeat protein